MTANSDAPTEDSDNQALQVDEVNLRELHAKLVELTGQLQRVADTLDTTDRDKYMSKLDAVGGYLHEEEIVEYNAADAESFRRMLAGLRSFRREYAQWERVIAEYALTRMNITQRDAATLLGVGVSTINRWAQHPLKVQDYS